MLTVDTTAAPWAHTLAKDIDQAIDARIFPYVQVEPVAIASLPAASKWAFRKFFITDGASSEPEVTSNGTDWVYPSGTTV